MSDLILHKKNEAFIRFECDRGIAQELSDYFTFYVPNFQFTPAYKSRVWDGKIRLADLRTFTIYHGLVPYIQVFCKERNYSLEIDSEISVTESEGAASVTATNDKTVQANDFVKEMISRIDKMQGENNFRDFWFYVKELQNFIFSSPNLKKDQRNDFKKQIGELCVQVKTRQEEMKAALSVTSTEKKTAIENLINEAIAQENSVEGIVARTLDELALGDPLVISAETTLPVSSIFMALMSCPPTSRTVRTLGPQI